MIKPMRIKIIAVALGVALGALRSIPSQAADVSGEGERRLALHKLSVLGSALYIGAHPDDENTALLAYLANDRLARTAYLSLTRGDGGQNLIGTEQGELLGVIRTEELLAARGIDGAEQMFTRAIDFGYSKSPAEALAVWGHDEVLGDVVWAIRSFRPDVLITRFPANGDGGHGHHTASAILAREAFAAAADPLRFPEQLARVRPWQARRLLWNSWRRDGDTRPVITGTVTVDIGTYEPLLGRSFTEIAAIGRTMHKSQGFGSRERRGAYVNELEPVAGDAPVSDLFDSIDTSWTRVPGGAPVAAALAEAEAAYEPGRPEAAVPGLLRARKLLDSLATDPWAELKRSEIDEVVRACLGLWLEAVAGSETAVAGSEVKVTTTAINRSSAAATLKAVVVPYAQAPALPAAIPLENNIPVTTEWTISLPPTFPASQPYWLERAPTGGMYAVADPSLVGRPRSPAALAVSFTLTLAGTDITWREPVVYRSTDPVDGERTRRLAVVPRVTVSLAESVLVFAADAPKRVRVTATSRARAEAGAVRLQVPQGWRVEPERVPLTLAGAGQTGSAELTVYPPRRSADGVLTAVFETGTEVFDRDMVRIDHRHIPVQTVLRPTRARVLRVELRHDGTRIGYVMGPGDEVPAVLRQLGYEVTELTDEELVSGALDRYDAIVAGVRAYNTREVLASAQARLLEYVKAGGTLVVQYNTSRGLVTEMLGPYPFVLSRDRVTEEDAAVGLTAPDHPLLSSPNRIANADFDGWVQERGLYFPTKWDPRYETVMTMHDGGEAPLAGAILFARYGKGAYVHTSLAFFRQLPAGVPGAIRLFANLLAAGGGA